MEGEEEEKLFYSREREGEWDREEKELLPRGLRMSGAKKGEG